MGKKAIFAAALLAIAAICIYFAINSGKEKKSMESAQSSTEHTMNDESTKNSSATDITTQKREQESTEETSETDSGEKKTEHGSEIQRTSSASIPAYSGTPYYEINGNVPDFTDEEKSNKEAFENYSDLDNLGRCGQAFANLCREMMPDDERGPIGQIKPSGWHTVKYNDLIDGNYLYNRCHLIAYSLAGENANEKNLITGTRYLNVEGMQKFEINVRDYILQTGNHVLYRVTPDFENDNLVASGVEIEAWSVENTGQGICFHVYCYNVQPGIMIDYTTGDSMRIEEDTNDSPATDTESTDNEVTEAPVRETQTEEDSSDSGLTQETGTVIAIGEETQDDQTNDRSSSGNSFESEERSYILNTNSKKIHLPDCNSVNDMKEKNKKQVTDSLDNLKEQGYKPCQRCLRGF